MSESAWSYLKLRAKRVGRPSVLEDAGVAVITAAIGYVFLDRPNASAKAVEALGYGLGAAVLWQVARWTGRFLFTAPLELHNSALAERDAALGSLKSLEERRPVTRDEWMMMASEFKSVQDLAVRASWDKNPHHEGWLLTGQMPVAIAHTEALCQRAGAMLLASPRVAARLSDRVRAHQNPVHRWLQFAREQRLTQMVMLNVSASVHGESIPVEAGYLENVPVVSARVCIECSAEEI
jgi:hypothetical protein